MTAVTGKLLSVDAGTGDCVFESLDPQMQRDFLSGYGLGVRLLTERMDPGCDPLGPDNVLGLAAGYLTGTGAYIASRYMVFGKSPVTGGWGDANAGGFFGRKLKNAGVDMILCRGTAAAPVYLLVEEGRARLLPAADLWGRDCYATEARLKEIHGADCEVACIGPAGENRSLIAGISTDHGRFAARSGLGAVMGAKRLKAVVAKGAQKIPVADPEVMKAARQKHLPVFRDGLAKGLSTLGTALFYDPCLAGGDAPVKNWAGTAADLKDAAGITAEKMLAYKVKPYACSGCPIGCGGYEQVADGPFATAGPVHKVEYETLGLLGSNLMIEEPAALIKLNDLCNRYGMDTIGCGGLCALAIECFENGLLDTTQTDGLDLTWGNAAAVVALVEKIGRSEGIGAVLSRGFAAAVEAFGPEAAQFAMAAGGEGLPAHDPRWSAGLGLTYATDPTPARHTQGSTTFPVAGYDQPEFTNADQGGRAPHQRFNVAMVQALNSAGLCLFGYACLDYRAVLEFLSAADGTAWTEDEFFNAGMRIQALRHLFNHKAGVKPAGIRFPARALGRPPLAAGPTAGVTVELERMAAEYFDLTGFDGSGLTKDAPLLKELGIAQFGL